MATIFIDNQPYVVKDGQNLLHACLSLGFNLPYFCWHPAMGSVGACRQCAVKQFRDENDTRGRLVMACMTPAADKTRISIEDPGAHEFRASVIEWMMLNHPHDCPVCDEGGECHLQDMTVMTGHTYRRYRSTKRTFYNQDLGPFVNHEMNRCIQCYRCVRFYRGYAGGHDFDAFVLRNHVYFGRQSDGVLESEFSGNLVEVCPTGVFTDKTLKQHYTRKWDLETAPSICANCGVGCNTIPGARYGMLRRIRNRFNEQVNGYFLCDRGRYGYEFVNSEKRVRSALLAEAGGQAQATRAAALQHLQTIFASGAKPVGIGSPRASLEDNFALRTLVGADNFYLGISDLEHRLLKSMLDITRSGPAHNPSLQEIRNADAVFILGEDVTNTAPVIALALRQAVRRQPMKIAAQMRIPEWDDGSVREALQQAKGPFFIASPYATRLDDVATQVYNAAPDDLARLGFAVARSLNAASPAVSDLPAETQTLAETIAKALSEAEHPLIIAGPGCGSEAVIQAAANIAQALCANGRPALLRYTVPESNSLGLMLMGGGELGAAARAIATGSADTIITLENNLYRRADAATVDAMLSTVRHLIAVDSLASATTAKAEVVLPAATFAEGDGTFVNDEGRAQRFYQVFIPEGDIQEGWRWLRDIMPTARRSEIEVWQDLDTITAALAEQMSIFRSVPDIAPPADFRMAGQKIPRQPARYSGRTAMRANINVSEPQTPPDPDSPLAFTMEGYKGQPPPALIPRFWAPGWNSIQALNKYQEEVGGPLRGGSPGIRLIEAATGNPAHYFGEIPAAFAPRTGELLLVPVYHIYGSEERSMLTPGVAELAPAPYIGLNAAAAEGLQAQEGDQIELAYNGTTYHLPVRLMPSLPTGTAGLPAGLPALDGIMLPGWGSLSLRREQPRT